MNLKFSNLFNNFFSKQKFFRKEIQFSEHNIEANYFHKNVLEIIKKLQNRNFDAYIVGGAIRDICFDLKPKDVDIVTNATPYEIKKIFRGSRIIGKRFKLVHIGYGRNIIEVSTFRKNAIKQNGFIKKDEKGKLLRDNLFGSEKDDIQRRDITINSLLYDPSKRIIIDYFDGFEDIKNKKIKVIGDPKKRFIEDPMRIIRIIRISSKLNLQIDEKLSRIMVTNIDLIRDIPSSRLFDEFCKMFTNGHAASCIVMLYNFNVLKILAPRLSDLMRNEKNLDKLLDDNCDKLEKVVNDEYWNHLIENKILSDCVNEEKQTEQVNLLDEEYNPRLDPEYTQDTNSKKRKSTIITRSVKRRRIEKEKQLLPDDDEIEDERKYSIINERFESAREQMQSHEDMMYKLFGKRSRMDVLDFSKYRELQESDNIIALVIKLFKQPNKKKWKEDDLVIIQNSFLRRMYSPYYDEKLYSHGSYDWDEYIATKFRQPLDPVLRDDLKNQPEMIYSHVRAEVNWYYWYQIIPLLRKIKPTNLFIWLTDGEWWDGHVTLQPHLHYNTGSGE